MLAKTFGVRSVSRNFRGAYAAGVLASAARRNEFVDLAPQKSQITNHDSPIIDSRFCLLLNGVEQGRGDIDEKAREGESVGNAWVNSSRRTAKFTVRC